MNESTLRAYYQDELRALRREGALFAKRYGDIAPALGLDWGENTDPMVERLVECMAWFSARLRQDSEARMPLAAQQILGLLYPSFACPIPSIGIVSFRPGPEYARKKPEGSFIPPGTSLHCIDGDGRAIRWRTAWQVHLHGVEVEGAEFIDGARHGLGGAARYFCFSTRGRARHPRFRLFLRGDPYTTYRLHELVHAGCVDVTAVGAGRKTRLDRSALRPAGLDEDALVLPGSRYAYPAYQLAQEYFVCPERFLFWDLDLSGVDWEGDVTICLGLRAPPPENLDLSFMVFDPCATPVVNLFETLAEPIRVDHTRHRHPLDADRARPDEVEVHSVLEVEAIRPGAGAVRVSEYFHGRVLGADSGTSEGDDLRWYSRVRPNPVGRGTVTEMYFKNTSGDYATPFVAAVRVLCTNRGRAEALGAATDLAADDSLDTDDIRMERPPSPQWEPAMFGDELWRLVSAITLHQRSLAGPNGVDALADVLSLYAPPGHNGARAQIAGICRLSCEEAVEVLRPTRKMPLGGVVRGQDYSVYLDREAFRLSSAFIFSSVLDRFLNLYCGIGGFSRLAVYMGSGSEPYCEWPARAGGRLL